MNSSLGFENGVFYLCPNLHDEGNLWCYQQSQTSETKKLTPSKHHLTVQADVSLESQNLYKK